MPKLRDYLSARPRFSGGGRLDPRKVRVGTDVRAVLDKIGIEHKDKGGERAARCPHPDHPDENPSWSIVDARGDGNNGLHHCQSCKWGGDVFELVQVVMGVGFREALLLVAGEASFEDVEVDWDVPVDESFVSYFPLPIELPGGVIPIEWDSDCWDYLRSVKPKRIDVGSEDVEHFGLKDWWRKGRVFIPVTREGELITWTARSYCEEKPKARTPTGGGGIKWGLFGLDLADREWKVVNLVEGWLDAVRLHQTGRQNVVAVGGSKLTQEQAGELEWADNIFVWPDGDRAGEVLVDDIVGWLGAGRRVWVIMIEEGKDPADYSPDELDKMQSVGYTEYRQRRNQTRR